MFRNRGKVTLDVEVRPTDLVAAIVDDLSKDEVFKLIIHIDEEVGEWSLTSRLADHFANLRVKFEAELEVEAQRIAEGHEGQCGSARVCGLRADTGFCGCPRRV